MTNEKPYPDHIISGIQEKQSICRKSQNDNHRMSEQKSFSLTQKILFRQVSLADRILSAAQYTRDKHDSNQLPLE